MTKTVVDGLRGDYSAIMDLCEHGEGFEYARKLLDVFECLYLSMHALSVDAGKCSCPGFWSKSVCWHVAFWLMKRGMGLSMGVRLGSFPIPGEAARLYLGIGKTSRLTLARPTMQNTPKRRKFHTKTSEVISTTSEASTSSNAFSLPPFHAIYNFMARQPDSTVEYVTPQGLFKTFVSECASSRERGCEHVAFLLNAVGEAAGGSSVVIRISHLVFVPQVARQQTVEADTSVLATALKSERAKHGQNLEVVGWIHDHDDLPDEPTIDFDCWCQDTFQKDNPIFLMLITGIRKETRTRRPRGDEWYDHENWYSWYSLTPKAVQKMQAVRLKVQGAQAQKKELRRVMGHTASVTDYVRKLAVKPKRADRPQVTITQVSDALSIIKPPRYLQFNGALAASSRLQAGGGESDARVLVDGFILDDLTLAEACDQIKSSFAVLALSSQSAWASVGELQRHTELDATTFEAAVSRCFQNCEIALIQGFARRFDKHRLRVLPQWTGARETDLFRCINHLGLFHAWDRYGVLYGDGNIKCVPLPVVRFIVEACLGHLFPFETQYEACLQRLSTRDFVQRDGDRVWATSTTIDEAIALEMTLAYMRTG